MSFRCYILISGLINPCRQSIKMFTLLLALGAKKTTPRIESRFFLLRLFTA